MNILKDLIKKVGEYIKDEPLDPDYVNKSINSAIDEINSYCFMPGCRKKCKNHRGVIIHIVKKHGITKEKVARMAYEHYRQTKTKGINMKYKLGRLNKAMCCDEPIYNTDIEPILDKPECEPQQIKELKPTDVFSYAGFIGLPPKVEDEYRNELWVQLKLLQDGLNETKETVNKLLREVK